MFNTPTGVTVDGSMNVYVADTSNHRIRKITSAGVVTTLAGSGAYGFADGTGVAARFYYPFGVTVDGSMNVYVADSNKQPICRIISSTSVFFLLYLLPFLLDICLWIWGKSRERIGKGKS